MINRFPIGSPVKWIGCTAKMGYAEVVGHCETYVHVKVGGTVHKWLPENITRNQKKKK